MPEIFINGQPVQAQDDETVLQAALAQRLLHPVLLLAQVAVDRRQLPHLRRAARRQELGRDRLQHAGRRRHAGADRLRPRPRAPQGDAAVHHAQPPGRLRHLRQGRRVHAAGLPLRVQRRAVDLDRAQGHARPSTSSCRSASCSTTSAASCARAACASPARSRSRTRSASSSAATSRWSARPRTARSSATPYSDNVVDICPVGALLSRSFLHKARVWYLKPTPSVCPGCARGCTRQRLAPQAGVEAQRARPEAERQHRARDAARERRRQRPVDLQQGPRPRADLRARPRRAADAEGQAGRPAGGHRRGAAADRRREACRWRWCRRGARTRSSPRSRGALGGRFAAFVKPDHVPAARRGGRGRPADPRRQEPEHRRGATRCFGDAPVRLRRGHRPRAGLGRRLQLRASCRAAPR